MKSADPRDRPFAGVPDLDPDWVLKMRAYLAHYQKTGIVHWTARGRKAFTTTIHMPPRST